MYYAHAHNNIFANDMFSEINKFILLTKFPDVQYSIFFHPIIDSEVRIATTINSYKCADGQSLVLPLCHKHAVIISRAHYLMVFHQDMVTQLLLSHCVQD